MKKILGLMIAAIALVGCSSGSNKVTKTCSMEQLGMKMAIIGTAKNWADLSNAKASDLKLENFVKTLSDGGYTCK